MTKRTGPRRGVVALAAATSLALLGALSVDIARAATTPTHPADDPARPGPDAVAAAAYTLGDAAFHIPGFASEPGGSTPADVELTGVVHYPRDLSGGPHPLVLLMHGLWQTCADRNSAPDSAAQNQWPCAPGTPPMPSYRGYDYLGENLASHGFVAVSISANGVNAGDFTTEDPARAALIDKHLAMWQQLAGTGGGPLAGRFTDPSSGAPVAVDFAGKVDLTDVGLLGHSRAGRGVMWQISDNHRSDWPAGVRVRAAFALAPAGIGVPEDPTDSGNFLPTDVPFVDWEGTCDPVIGDFFDVNGARDAAGSYGLTVHGANHDFLNTQWSPSSGQVDAYDDANHPAPGRCTQRDGTAVRQLTEDQERTVATGYVSAFFRRYLDGDRSMDPILTGTTHPYSSLTTVDVASH